MRTLFTAICWLLLTLSRAASILRDGEEILFNLHPKYNDNYDAYEKRSLDPELTMTVNEIIRYHGYPVEDFDVQTEDGYIITIQRIPYGKKGPGDGARKPVIINMDCWLLLHFGLPILLTKICRRIKDVLPSGENLFSIYQERLRHRVLPTVSSRLKRAYFILTFQIVDGLVDISHPRYSVSAPTIARNHDYRLLRLKAWYSIPSGVVVRAFSLNAFTSHVDDYYSGQFWGKEIGAYAYILADEGYDVWLTNVRGNVFGRRHVKLSPNRKEFWKFSWDEMAQYDMPAMIDFILHRTGFNETFYIGHSMGTTVAFAMLASKPQYNKKVRGIMALAPVAYVDHATSPMRLLAPFANDLGFLVTLLGTGEFLANNKLLNFLTSTVCHSEIKVLCSSLLFVTLGYNPQQLNQTRLPVFLQTTPSGTSVQSFVHYAQEISSHKFTKYDYGFWENKAKYGQGTPPTYRIENIKAPVAAFWSDNDLLAVPEDVARLTKQLPNLVLNYRVADPKFSHLDYMWAIDVKKLLYDRLILKMEELWQY